MEKGVDDGLISQPGGILQLIKVIAVQLSLAVNFGAIRRLGVVQQWGDYHLRL